MSRQPLVSTRRVGIVGCGKVASMHAAALALVPNAELAAACDADGSRAEAFAARYGGRAFADLGTMLREAGIEVLLVCTPHPLHPEAVITAAEAGVACLVEKPLAVTVDDCDRMIAAAAAAGLPLGVVSQRRWFEPVRRMKATIDAGLIGPPVLGTVTMLSWRDPSYYQSDPWRGRWSTEGGGVLVNQSPHHLDLLLWCMGPVASVAGQWANLNHPSVEVEDTAVATLRFASGGLGSIVVSLSQKPGLWTKVHVHGAAGGSVGVQTDGGATFIAGVSAAAEPPVTDLWNVPGSAETLDHLAQQDRAAFAAVDPNTYYHAQQIVDFIEALNQGRSPAVTGEDGRRVVQLFQAIYQSQRTGEIVVLAD